MSSRQAADDGAMACGFRGQEHCKRNSPRRQEPHHSKRTPGQGSRHNEPQAPACGPELGATIGRFMTEPKPPSRQGRCGRWHLAAAFSRQSTSTSKTPHWPMKSGTGVRILGPGPGAGAAKSNRRLLMSAQCTHSRECCDHRPIPVKDEDSGTEKVVDAEFSVPGKASAVELLGRGQYWNADGRHPSGMNTTGRGSTPSISGPFTISDAHAGGAGRLRAAVTAP